MAFFQVGPNLTPPANSSIPTSSLPDGGQSANTWTGITSPATTVSTSGGLKYITNTNPEVTPLATGQSWRDQEITTWITAGNLRLRKRDGDYLFFSLGVASPNVIRMGIASNGTEYNTYVNDSPGSSITGWNTDGTHSVTFGVRGFDVYLKLDGTTLVDTSITAALNPLKLLTYKEYRRGAMQDGTPQVQLKNGGLARDITFTYFTMSALASKYGVNSFDPRDFGMRSIGAVIGSISSSSQTLNLNSAADIRVGDKIIVEIGGESGAGIRNTSGVGGVTPILHYANATARDADTSQADNTYAYLDTDGSVYLSTGGSWSAANLGGAYYIGVKNPFSLVSYVTAVNASPATQVTLATAATTTTTNANIYLDSSPSFYPATTFPGYIFQDGRDDGFPTYTNMTVNCPAGTWYVSSGVNIPGNGYRTGLTFCGQGKTSTIFQSPKGCPSGLIADLGVNNNNITVRDFKYIGNHADNGFMFNVTGANRNFNGYPGAINQTGASSNYTVTNIIGRNCWNGCPTLAGTNHSISNIDIIQDTGPHAYIAWQVQLSNATGGSINNCTYTCPELGKAFEVFACNGSQILNTTSVNGGYSTNSSTSWTISNFDITITSGSGQSGIFGIDEAIISCNNNAFGSGSFGTIGGTWRIVQQGYIDTSKNSLKAIHVLHQTDVTITGAYPGTGGCTTALSGYISAPNYDAGSAEYGSIILSDVARTTVTGVRIVGSAITTPGHSGHFGNISLLGASSSVTNCVADAIQTGPTLSGNQTNAQFCP